MRSVRVQRKQLIERVLREEHEDQCQHIQVSLEFPDIGYDIEGMTVGLMCLQCGQHLEYGTILE